MVRAKKDGQFLNCYIRRDIIEKLTIYSGETSIPKTAVVEKALQKYLNEVVDVEKGFATKKAFKNN